MWQRHAAKTRTESRRVTLQASAFEDITESILRRILEISTHQCEVLTLLTTTVCTNITNHDLKEADQRGGQILASVLWSSRWASWSPSPLPEYWLVLVFNPCFGNCAKKLLRQGHGAYANRTSCSPWATLAADTASCNQSWRGLRKHGKRWPTVSTNRVFWLFRVLAGES